MPGANAKLWQKLLLVLLPLVLLLVAEAVARVVSGSPDTNRVVVLRGAEGRPLTDAAGRVILATDPAMAGFVGQDIGRRFFVAEKDPGVTRIFVLGASTVYGLLYQPYASFSRFLEVRLKQQLGGRPVEVINTGISGFDSTDYPQLAEELSGYAPDLMLIYAGHNELKYPNLARIKKPASAFVASLLQQSALFGLLIHGSTVPPLPEPYGTQPWISEEESVRAERYFQSALAAVVAAGRELHIPVMVCAPASNVLDKAPRLSVFSQLPSVLLDDLKRLLQRWGPTTPNEPSRLANADLAVAAADLNTVDAWLAQHEEAAILFFLKGRLLCALGETGQAVAAFRRSLELDNFPERAPPRLVDVARDVGRQRGAVLVDVDRRLWQEAAAGIPGFDLFYDYCHPNLFGHWLIADEILCTLRQHELLFTAEDWTAGEDLSFAACQARLDLNEDRLLGPLVKRVAFLVGESLEQRGPAQSATLERAANMLEHVFATPDGLKPETMAEAHLVRAVIAALLQKKAAVKDDVFAAQALDEVTVRRYAGLVASHPSLATAFVEAGLESDGEHFKLVKQP